MTTQLLNRAKMSVHTEPMDTDNFAVGSAVVPFRSFANAGAVGSVTLFPYLIEDGVQWEIGIADYQASAYVVRGVTQSSNSNLRIVASGDAIVSAIMRAEDVPSPLFSSLSDVNVTEGAGINGYTTNWDNSSSKWIAVAPLVMPTNGSFNFHTLSDVSVSEGSGIDNYTLYWNNTDSMWEAVWTDGFHTPPASNFGVSNLGSGVTMTATLTAARGLTVVRTDNGAAGANRTGFLGVACPGGSTWSVTARMKFMTMGTINSGAACVMTLTGLSGAGVYYGVGVSFYSSGGLKYAIETMNTTGLNATFNTPTNQIMPLGAAFPEWFSATWSSGTLTFYYSFDGANWTQIYQITSIASMADIGVMMCTYASFSSARHVADVLNWLVTTNATPGG